MEISRSSYPTYNPALDKKAPPPTEDNATKAETSAADSSASKPAEASASASKTASTAKSSSDTTTSKTQGDGKSKEVGKTEEPSSIKSFTYGALGLEHPEQQAKENDTNPYYSAGRWLAAAATVGTIIRLLV